MRQAHAAPAVDAISRSMRVEIVRSEGSVILLFGAVLIASFDLITAASGTALPALYIYLDVLQCIALIGLGLALRSDRLPERRVPWVFAAGLILNTAVSNYGAGVVGEGSLASILVMLVLLGAVIGFWVPFIVGAVLCFAITAIAVTFTVPEEAITWAFAALTALAFAAVVLWGRRRTVAAAAAAQAQVQALATRDSLTGLLNRRGLDDAWTMLHARAVRRGTPVFAVFIDVAGLKAVNDAVGHAVGDALLLRVADALRARSRGDELLARWGGDEFVIVGLGAAPDAQALGSRVLGSMDTAGLEEIWSAHLWVGSADGPATTPLQRLVDGADATTRLCPAATVEPWERR